MVLRSLFFISAILLKDLSPEQFETMRHMYTRSAIATFGKAPYGDFLCTVKQQEKLEFYSLGTMQSEQTEPFRHKTYLALNLWNMLQPKFVRVPEVDHYQAHEIQRSL